jgi:hypothetical protein
VFAQAVVLVTGLHSLVAKLSVALTGVVQEQASAICDFDCVYQHDKQVRVAGGLFFVIHGYIILVDFSGLP